MSYKRVLDLDDLAIGTATGVEVDGEPVCSHEQYELSEGWVEIDDAAGDDPVVARIECALHGSTFNLDSGAPESLPAVKPVPIYACRVLDGGIEVDRAEQLNDATVPRH